MYNISMETKLFKYVILYTRNYLRQSEETSPIADRLEEGISSLAELAATLEKHFGTDAALGLLCLGKTIAEYKLNREENRNTYVP